MNYVLPPAALVPLVLSNFLAEHVTGQFRLMILMEPCWMEASWLPTVLDMSEDVPWHSPVVKDLIMMLGRPGTQESAMSAFNPLAA